MRYLLLIIIPAVLASSCQLGEKNISPQDESFVKYYGELTSYEAGDIEIIYDATGEIAEGLVVFGTKKSTLGDRDYFVLRTDLQGNLIDSISYGFVNGVDRDYTGDGLADDFRGDEMAGQIHPIPGGGFITIGTSSITENASNISDFQILTIGFLDDDLNLAGDTLLALVSQTDNTDLDLIGNDVTILSDGTILIVGAREVSRGGSTDLDNYFLKFSFTGDVIFEIDPEESIKGEDDTLVRCFEKANGNISLIGYGNVRTLFGENNGNNGNNVYYRELDPNGTPFNSVAYGLDDISDDRVFNEMVSSAIKTSFGYSIVGTSITSQDQRYAFLMNLSNNGVYLSGNSHDSSAYNTGNVVLQTNGYGVTQAINNDIIMVGQYQSFITGNLSRGEEGMFVKFDQSATPVAGAESFFGLSDGNDSVIDAVTLPDGKIAVVANVDFGGGVTLISIIKINDNGSLD